MSAGVCVCVYLWWRRASSRGLNDGGFFGRSIAGRQISSTPPSYQRCLLATNRNFEVFCLSRRWSRQSLSVSSSSSSSSSKNSTKATKRNTADRQHRGRESSSGRSATCNNVAALSFVEDTVRFNISSWGRTEDE